MAAHNDLGKAGEEMAVAYLERNDYVIRHRNWRKNHLELDIVAAKDNELIVVEVKTRANTDYMDPEEAVTPQKIRRIVTAADAYVKHFGLDNSVRFDIITLVGSEGAFTLHHIEDAFKIPLTTRRW
ncbi:MAG: YraN family protein [Prevotellaceae bacterium]|jgi:putative endonuclease|nr:YraN family protein [Prevotellaceae bacterium]